jgi:hydrogenase expression/formation protein HypD
MRYLDEFRDSRLGLELAERIRREVTRPLCLMEVCGTHTMAIARYGIKGLLPPHLRLISGPGCPVCVTPQAEIDWFMALGRLPEVILATFGDMMRVPGTSTTLEAERARGADVRVVYAPLDAVAIALGNPARRVVFFGVGFETTTPAVALAVREARRMGVGNFLVLGAHKLIPPAMMALARDPEVAIDGFLCPGHVSAIIGSRAYDAVARECGIGCVVSGFEPLDILQSILMLGRQALAGRPAVEVQYARAVSRSGNPAAQRCVYEVFEPADAEWRGLGVIPESGLRLTAAYHALDAAQLLPPPRAPAPTETGCECGMILKGVKQPADCRAFGGACTPERPLGPCMVSSEGACAAVYRYAASPPAA